MLRTVPALLLPCLLIGCAAAAQPEAAAQLDTDAPPEQAAQTAAEAWLVHMDRSDYGRTWSHASSIFRAAVSASDWEDAARRVRQQTGAFQSRELFGARYQTELPNAPRGEYVTLQYNSSFSRMRSATETVIMHLDEGTWRVSGYFVR
jgi:hypothetical protein